jgi:hypothetical protein
VLPKAQGLLRLRRVVGVPSLHVKESALFFVEGEAQMVGTSYVLSRHKRWQDAVISKGEEWWLSAAVMC